MDAGVARLYWRARIETVERRFWIHDRRGSPVFIGGRGLKRHDCDPVAHNLRVRPSLLAGAD